MKVQYWTQEVWTPRGAIAKHELPHESLEEALRAAGTDTRRCAYSTALLEPLGVDAMNMRRFMLPGATGLAGNELEMFVAMGRAAHVAAVKYRRTRLLDMVESWRAYNPRLQRAYGVPEDVDRQVEAYEREAEEWLAHLRSL